MLFGHVLTAHQIQISTDISEGSGSPPASAANQTCQMSVNVHIPTEPASLYSNSFTACVLCGSVVHNLEHNLDDTSHYWQFVEFNSCKYLYPLIEELLNVAEKTAVHCTTINMSYDRRVNYMHVHAYDILHVCQSVPGVWVALPTLCQTIPWSTTTFCNG